MIGGNSVTEELQVLKGNLRRFGLNHAVKRSIFRALGGGVAIVYLATNSVWAHAPESNFWKERQTHLQKAAPIIAPRELVSNRIKSSGPITLPYHYGTLRQAVAPRSSKTEKTVILIQDIHQNSEAQSNIAGAVETLLQNDQIDLIALEGAFEKIDLTPYQRFARRDTIQKLADYLLKKGLISGPVHTVMLSNKEIEVVGVDDQQDYSANVEAYRSGYKEADKQKKEIEQETEQFAAAKKKIFSAELLAFDARVNAYRADHLSMGDYLKDLVGRSSDVPFSIQTFLEASEAESKLDYARVERERTMLLEVLVKKLTPKEIETLGQASVAYRLGNTGHREFYEYLRALCRKSGVLLTSYPAMQSYVQYVLLSDSLNIEQINSDLRVLENQVYASLVKTEPEKILVKKSRALYLQGRLVEYALTPDEWKEYVILSGAKDLEVFELFYEKAEHRNHSLAANLIKAMSNQKTAVLVAGGFHTPGVAPLLAEAGITTLVFSPKITSVEKSAGTSYLSVFQQDKTPLDELFKGEKLFMAPNPLGSNVGNAALGTVIEGSPDAFNQLSGLSIPSQQIKVDEDSVEVEQKIRLEVERNSSGEITDHEIKTIPVSVFREAAQRILDVAKAKHDEWLEYFRREGFPGTRKVDGSAITEADFEIQLAVLKEIQTQFPGHYLLAEEDLSERAPEEARLNEANENSDYVWVLDPIDGTSRFAIDSDFYAIPLALFYRGELAAARVWLPKYGFLETSAEQSDVYLNGREVEKLTDKPALSELKAVIAGRMKEAEFLKATIGRQNVDTSIGSTVVRVAQMLIGSDPDDRVDFTAYLSRKKGNGLWDFAAIAAIFQKAGGLFYILQNGRLRPVMDVIRETITDPAQRFKDHRFVAGTPTAMKKIEPTLSGLGAQANNIFWEQWYFAALLMPFVLALTINSLATGSVERFLFIGYLYLLIHFAHAMVNDLESRFIRAHDKVIASHPEYFSNEKMTEQSYRSYLGGRFRIFGFAAILGFISSLGFFLILNLFLFAFTDWTLVNEYWMVGISFVVSQISAFVAHWINNKNYRWQGVLGASASGSEPNEIHALKRNLVIVETSIGPLRVPEDFAVDLKNFDAALEKRYQALEQSVFRDLAKPDNIRFKKNIDDLNPARFADDILLQTFKRTMKGLSIRKVYKHMSAEKAPEREIILKLRRDVMKAKSTDEVLTHLRGVLVFQEAEDGVFLYPNNAEFLKKIFKPSSGLGAEANNILWEQWYFAAPLIPFLLMLTLSPLAFDHGYPLLALLVITAVWRISRPLYERLEARFIRSHDKEIAGHPEYFLDNAFAVESYRAYLKHCFNRFGVVAMVGFAGTSGLFLIANLLLYLAGGTAVDHYVILAVSFAVSQVLTMADHWQTNKWFKWNGVLGASASGPDKTKIIRKLLDKFIEDPSEQNKEKLAAATLELVKTSNAQEDLLLRLLFVPLKIPKLFHDLSELKSALYKQVAKIEAPSTEDEFVENIVDFIVLLGAYRARVYVRSDTSAVLNEYHGSDGRVVYYLSGKNSEVAREAMDSISVQISEWIHIVAENLYGPPLSIKTLTKVLPRAVTIPVSVLEPAIIEAILEKARANKIDAKDVLGRITRETAYYAVGEAEIEPNPLTIHTAAAQLLKAWGQTANRHGITLASLEESANNWNLFRSNQYREPRDNVYAVIVAAVSPFYQKYLAELVGEKYPRENLVIISRAEFSPVINKVLEKDLEIYSRKIFDVIKIGLSQSHDSPLKITERERPVKTSEREIIATGSMKIVRNEKDVVVTIDDSLKPLVEAARLLRKYLNQLPRHMWELKSDEVTFDVTIFKDADNKVFMSNVGDNKIEIDDEALRLSRGLLALLLHHEMHETELAALENDLLFYRWLYKTSENMWFGDDLSFQPYAVFLEENWERGNQSLYRRMAAASFIVEQAIRKAMSKATAPNHVKEILTKIGWVLPLMASPFNPNLVRDLNILAAATARRDKGHNSPIGKATQAELLQKLDRFFEQPLKGFVWSSRELERLGINTIRQLVVTKKSDLIMWRIAEYRIGSYEKDLAVMGLRLGMSEGDVEQWKSQRIRWNGPAHEFLERQVDNLHLSGKVRRAIAQFGILFVGQLVTFPHTVLRGVKNIGPTTIDDLNRELGQNNGLRLGMSHNEIAHWTDPTLPLNPDQLIATMPFSIRVKHFLRNRDIDTMRELVKKTEASLQFSPNQLTDMLEIREELLVRGLWLGMSELEMLQWRAGEKPTKPVPDGLLNSSVRNREWSTRARQRFGKLKIKTWKELAKTEESEFIDQNSGPVTLREIKLALAEWKLRLGMTDAELAKWAGVPQSAPAIEPNPEDLLVEKTETVSMPANHFFNVIVVGMKGIQQYGWLLALGVAALAGGYAASGSAASLAGMVLVAGIFNRWSKPMSPTTNVPELAEKIRGVMTQADAQGIAALIPIGPLGINGNQPGVLSGLNYIERQELNKILSKKGGSPLALTLQQKREILAQLDGYQFNPLKDKVGDANLLLDINVQSASDIPAAARLIKKVHAQMGDGKLLIPIQSNLKRDLQAALGGLGRIQYVQSKEGFYSEKGVFDLESVLKTFSPKTLQKTFIALRGEYKVSKYTWDRYQKASPGLKLLLLSEWLEGVLRAVEVDRQTLEKIIDRTAKIAIQA